MAGFYRMSLASFPPSKFSVLHGHSIAFAPKSAPAPVRAIAPLGLSAPALAAPAGMAVAKPTKAAKAANVMAEVVPCAVMAFVLTSTDLLKIIVGLRIEVDQHALSSRAVSHDWRTAMLQLDKEVGSSKHKLKMHYALVWPDPYQLLAGWGNDPLIVLPNVRDELESMYGGELLSEWETVIALDEEQFKDRIISHKDAITTLDLKGTSGWLSGGVLDAYFAAFVHDVRRETINERFCMADELHMANELRIYLPNQLMCPCMGSSYYLHGYATNFPHIVPRLRNASFIDGTYNVGKFHWAFYCVVMMRECLNIFEPAHFTAETHGKELLRVLSEVLMRPEMASWKVNVIRPSDGLLEQTDGKSCGVYAAVIGEHVIKGRRMPKLSPSAILEWRTHILATIIGLKPVVA